GGFGGWPRTRHRRPEHAGTVVEVDGFVSVGGDELHRAGAPHRRLRLGVALGAACAKSSLPRCDTDQSRLSPPRLSAAVARILGGHDHPNMSLCPIAIDSASLGSPRRRLSLRLPMVRKEGNVADDWPTRLADAHGRVGTDLRISVTDRCNLRCVY